MALLIDSACVSACVCVFQILMEHVQEQYYELMSFLTFLKLSSSYFAAFFFLLTSRVLLGWTPCGCHGNSPLASEFVSVHK